MKNDRNFELFTGGPTEAYQKRIHVTIGKNGMILLNRNIFQALGSPAAVQLYYNREKCIIGLEPSNPRLAVSFPVRQQQGNFRIQASSFCQHYGIRTEGTEKFLNVDVDADGTLKLDLRNTIRISRPKRKRKPREHTD